MLDALPAQMHTGSIWHFSRTEIEHLAMATCAFTLALGFMMGGGIGSIQAYGFSTWIMIVLTSMPLMLVAVGPAFLLHEMGHKIVARYYGCWAEFRGDPSGLRFGILISLLLGIVFMSPGAVMVAGSINRKQNGHIAIAGPVVNLILLFIGIIGGGILLGIVGMGGILESIIYFWIISNLILGLFNMLPFGPLDGVKVKAWSEEIYWTLFLIFAVPVIFLFLGFGSPYDLAYWIAVRI